MGCPRKVERQEGKKFKVTSNYLVSDCLHLNSLGLKDRVCFFFLTFNPCGTSLCNVRAFFLFLNQSTICKFKTVQATFAGSGASHQCGRKLEISPRKGSEGMGG